MNVEKTKLSGVLVFEPSVFRDDRGWFTETFHETRYRDAGVNAKFVQDNHSFSHRGVLRGLHYQVERPQPKLVRVMAGAIFDVAVDLRQGSETFGQWVGVELSGENHKQLYIPGGFAHGFCVLGDSAHVIYKCGDYYDPFDEGGVRYDDPTIQVKWPIDSPVISKKDLALPKLDGAKLPK